jgi:hypothetical protein
MLDEKYLQIAQNTLRWDYFSLSPPAFADNRLYLHIFIVITSTVVEFAQERL